MSAVESLPSSFPRFVEFGNYSVLFKGSTITESTKQGAAGLPGSCFFFEAPFIILGPLQFYVNLESLSYFQLKALGGFYLGGTGSLHPFG